MPNKKKLVELQRRIQERGREKRKKELPKKVKQY